MQEPFIIDMSGWQPDRDYEECFRLCVQLKLAEAVMHGDEEYCRLTKKGINVLYGLMHVIQQAADPDNALKAS